MLLVILSQLPEWQPFQFHGKEHFEYSIVQVEDGEKKEGKYEISIDGSTLTIKGNWDGTQGSVTVQASSPDQIPTQMMAQIMFNPWLAPLGATLFATMPYYMIAAEGITSMEQTENGKTMKISSGKTCSYAGQKGKRLLVEQDGRVIYDLCISKDIGLPLYLKSVSDDGSIYEARLVKYTR